MKHPLIPTITIILLFVLAQIIGIAVIYRYIDAEQSTEQNELVYRALPFGQERPDIDASSSFAYITIAIALGTIILLILIHFKLFSVWKIWFALAIWTTLLIAFSAFMNEWLALILAVIFAGWKILRPNIIVHNLSELFIYAGIAAILVPVMNLLAAVLLLLIIAIYDYWAVFHSKHMITLAKASSEARIFPGLQISYRLKKGSEARAAVQKKDTDNRKDTDKDSRKTKNQNDAQNLRGAILGGGDIAFALIFAATVFAHNYLLGTALLKTSIIILGTTAGLAITLFLAQKDKFYPAMPSITAGAILALGVTLLF